MTNNNPKKVFNLIILDESGSMQSIKNSIIGGFNEIIQTIRNAAVREVALQQWISFWSFNGSEIKEQIPLTVVNQLTELNSDSYRPDASTPLYDAIAKACNSLAKASSNEKDAAFLVTILTDGEENSSEEYSFEAIANLIKELKLKGWVFTYIGANHDVEKTAVSINIYNSKVLHASDNGVAKYISQEKNSRDRFYAKLKQNKKIDPDEKYFQED